MNEQNAGSMLKSGDQPRVTEREVAKSNQPPSLSYTRGTMRSTPRPPSSRNSYR